ncbi:glutamate dehydrogenase [Streptomyces sp. NPDC048845]|uniref:terpene synthase family protein n=1 Tax=Streptomyces sp. NPDC048845 TaxID=3155390 RepID=UPI00343BDEEB
MNTASLGMLPFYCPLESAVHPGLREAERRAVDWIDRLGFCPTEAERRAVLASHSADFYARFAPEADPERLWITACWVYWGFAFDDARCDEGELSSDPARFAAMAGRVQRALEVPGPYPCADRYAAAAHDLGELFRACATPLQVGRFVRAHRGWLSGVQWQVGNAARGRLPDLDEYIVMRLHSAGGEPTYAMLEIANGAEVPAREMDTLAVTALTEMAVFVAAMDNDRHSFAKERNRGQTDQNFLSVLRQRHGLTPEQALYEGVALRDRVLCRFLAVRERVLRRGSQELRRYLTDLGHGIRGNIEWGLRVPRYLARSGGPGDGPGGGPAGTASRTTADDWAERPLDGSAGPPVLAPSIAWWWDDSLLRPDRPW